MSPRVSLACAVLFAGVASTALLAQRTFEQPVQPGQIAAPATSAARAQFDPPAAPMHPLSANRPPPPPEAPPGPNTAAMAVLADFPAAYAAAGSPRIAVLYNQTFANKISSWTLDVRQMLQLPASADGRSGFATENLQWFFEEGFAKPFIAAGVKLVDPALVMQAASRREGWREIQHAADINSNVEALKLHTDWIAEVLMVPDSQTTTGYLFRVSIKRLSDGRIIASGVSTLEEFRQNPEKTRVVYDDAGYRFVPDEMKKPTVDDYAQSIAVKLLVDLTRKLPAYAIPAPAAP